MSGINDSPLFEEEDDYQHFRNVLTRVFDPRVSELGHVLHASFLASTHIHLLITVPAGDTIATSVKRLSSAYTYYYNTKHGHMGHVFQDRFKSEPVEDQSYFEYLKTYIHSHSDQSMLVQSSADAYAPLEYHPHRQNVKMTEEQALLLYSQIFTGDKSMTSLKQHARTLRTSGASLKLTAKVTGLSVPTIQKL